MPVGSVRRDGMGHPEPTPIERRDSAGAQLRLRWGGKWRLFLLKSVLAIVWTTFRHDATATGHPARHRFGLPV